MRRQLIFVSVLIVLSEFGIQESTADIAGNAILFDGTQDFLRIPDAPHLGGMSGLTIELWFMPHDTSRDNPIFTKSDRIAIMTDRSYELALAPHTPSWAVFTGSTGWTWLHGSTPPPVTVDQWTHIAATYDSIEGVANLYFDATLFLTTTTDAYGLPISELIRDSREDLILGAILANPYHGALFSSGVMDEVRIWNYGRSTSQIAQNYDRVVDPTENGLIGYWNFDEDFSSQTIIDSSIFGLDGTLGYSYDTELSDPVRVISTAPIVPAPDTLSGWVWMEIYNDFGYSLDEGDLVYFLSIGPVWYYNITTGQWLINKPVGWIFVDWPYLYVLDTDTLMFALPPEDSLWVYHFSTDEWVLLPQIMP